MSVPGKTWAERDKVQQRVQQLQRSFLALVSSAFLSQCTPFAAAVHQQQQPIDAADASLQGLHPQSCKRRRTDPKTKPSSASTGDAATAISGKLREDETQARRIATGTLLPICTSGGVLPKDDRDGVSFLHSRAAVGCRLCACVCSRCTLMRPQTERTGGTPSFPVFCCPCWVRSASLSLPPRVGEGRP